MRLLVLLTLVVMPLAGKRPMEGRRPKRLLNAHGMRTDPAVLVLQRCFLTLSTKVDRLPMSDPQPCGAPLNANSAPSPTTMIDQPMNFGDMDSVFACHPRLLRRKDADCMD